MNGSQAAPLARNLLKNAFDRTEAGGHIAITVGSKQLCISKDGKQPLDAEHIFDRFFQGEKKEGSTGLGLALVKAVCRYYGLGLEYRYVDGRHTFTVDWR